MIDKINETKHYSNSYFIKFVKERANYTCEICGSKKQIEAHHIVSRGNYGKSSLNNGIALCHKCHKLIHGGNCKGKNDLSQSDVVRLALDDFIKKHDKED